MSKRCHQERLAETLEVSRSTVARWERGEGGMYPRQRNRLAQALGLTANELEAVLAPRSPLEPTGGFRGGDVASLAAKDIRLATLQAMAGFRHSDSCEGGGQLYDEVVDFLSEALAPHCFGVLGARRSDVFAAAASVTEMAGWMAYEAGRPGQAEQHFGRAHDLSTLSGDTQLQAHILASRSHLACQVGQVRRAGSLAKAGADVLRKGAHSGSLAAKLHLLAAQALAQEADADRCRELARRAETAFATDGLLEDSPWLSPFDEASLANELAKCMCVVGDHQEALRQAQVVLDNRPTERVRSRAFAQLTMAQALIADDQLDEARSVTESTVIAVESLQSAPVDHQLAQLQSSFRSYGAN